MEGGESPEIVADVSEPDAVEQLAKDYTEYTKIDTFKERHQFEDNIEEMLTHLDEFCGLVDLIRSDTNLCLDRTLPSIYAKAQEMKHIFERIDELEAFVAVVKKDVNYMEDCLNKAESEMGSFSSVKKMFSGISLPGFLSSKKSSPKPSPTKPAPFSPPVIFNTEDYLIQSEGPKEEAAATGYQRIT